MKKIPENIEDWSLGVITDLIHEGYEENEQLEFKGEINSESDRIGKTCCAFANTGDGVIVFGVDDDRSKSLQTRLHGLEESNQLKRKIVDQIKNIKPPIPLKYLIFKSNNVKASIEGRVFIILKILRSNEGPHQYQNIFYKRISDGNEPMTFEEISNQIIESRRTGRILSMIMSEAGLIDAYLKMMEENIKNNSLEIALDTGLDISVDAFSYFFYNQAYLYSFETYVNTSRLIESVKKIKHVKSLMDSANKLDEKDRKAELKESGFKTFNEYGSKLLKEHIDDIYKNIEFIEKELNTKRIPAEKRSS